jgi:hypothetical protein
VVDPQFAQRGAWNRCASSVLTPIGQLDELSSVRAVFDTANHSLRAKRELLPACGNAPVQRPASPG